jgi:hypothetical protein
MVILIIFNCSYHLRFLTAECSAVKGMDAWLRGLVSESNSQGASISVVFQSDPPPRKQHILGVQSLIESKESFLSTSQKFNFQAF